MKIILLTLILFWPLSAVAAPFLVCDPQPGIDHYVITGLPAGLDGSNVTPDATGKYGFVMDLTATPKASTSNLTVAACNSWGDCSSTVPFVLQRPSAPTSPQNIRLTK